MDFLHELASRNWVLYWFGWICLIGALVMLVLIFTTTGQVLGINAFIKPLKFFLSTVIFSWSMGWYIWYLNMPGTQMAFSWTVIATLSFELFWITFKAANGELSHFNVSTAFNGMMFGLMGMVISIMTLFTLYIGILFCIKAFPELPVSYLWGIRLGIICFVIFAFQGGVMGSQLAHTVGAVDGGPGLPVLNWSTKYGDLRVAHFVGMHALQILPLVGFYLLSSTRGVIIFSVIYFGLCFGVFLQALLKLPLFKI